MLQAKARRETERSTVDDQALELLEKAAIPVAYHHCLLENYYPQGHQSSPEFLSQANAMLDGKYLVKNFPVTDRGLFYMGRPGVGKTHLAIALLKELIVTYKVRGLFLDYGALVEELEAYYNHYQESCRLASVRHFAEVPLLLIDDLGCVTPPPAILEVIGHLIRVRHSRKTITLITTNYSDGENYFDTGLITDRIGERINSRLCEMTKRVFICGSDYRLKLTQDRRG
ncbi:MAG: ATP-binding protein [Acidobacteriota bacterium]